MKKSVFSVLVSSSAILALPVLGQGTAFTYHGQLNDNGTPATGIYDLEFRLFDALSGGAQVGGTLSTDDLGVTNGLFTVVLDFGPGVFTGPARWLQVAVRPGASAGTYTSLVPRQPTTSTPYAIRSANAGIAVNVSGPVSASQLTGTISPNNIGAGAVTTSALADGAVTAAKIGGTLNAGQIPDLDASKTTSGSLADARLSANVSLLNGTNVFTTTNRFAGVVTATNLNNQFRGHLEGDVTGNVSGSAASVTGPLAGDVTGIQAATIVSTVGGQPAGNIAAGANAANAATNANRPNTLVRRDAAGNFVAGGITADSFSGSGAGLTSLNASQLTGTISPNNIGAGAVSANHLAAGAVTTSALANGAVASTKMATESNWFAVTIMKPNPAATDDFGYSVAALGTDRVLIGAPTDDTSANDAGAAYLFSTNGNFLATFNNPTPASLDHFGWFVATVGSDRVLIGAPKDTDSGDLWAGAAYLFRTNGALLTTFESPLPQQAGNFGWSVATAGASHVLIGEPFHDVGNGAGAAYLFTTNGTLLASFNSPTPQNGDEFGYSVATVGIDRVLIGALNDNAGGAAYLFNTNGTLLTTFNNPTPAVADNFGRSVAAVGTDRVLIGASGDNTGANDAGAAYLFSTDGTLLTTFNNPTPASDDRFGYSVAAVGTDRVLIGATRDNTGATASGAAYLFRTDGTLLTTFNNPTPAFADYFGSAVAAVGTDRVLIGAYTDNAVANDAEAAYLFSLGTFTAGLVADTVRARSITTVSLDDGAVTAVKISGVLFPSQIPDLDASKIVSGTLPDARLTTISTAGKVANSATTAASANTPNAIVARDGSGNFSAGNVTAAALKFPSAQNFVLQISGSGFVPDSQNEGYNRGSGLISPASGDTDLQFHATVQLPQGATVTKLVGVFYDASTTDDFTLIDLRLRYFSTSGTFPETTVAEIVGQNTVGFSDGRREFETTAISPAVINNTTRAYSLDVHFTVTAATSNTRFYGIRIEYTLDTLLP